MHANRKTAYINGKIFTSDRENLHAEAMTVENGRITWVGAQADLPAGPYDETVDLQGRRVLPGFVDAHEHPVMLADFSKKISSLPPKVNSIEELKQAIRDVREQQGPGKWIEGWGYDEGKLAEKRSPTRYDLDEGCSDSPVSIIRTCGHIRCVNSKALEMAGINKDTPDPQGGQIDRDENGEPTRIPYDRAGYMDIAPEDRGENIRREICLTLEQMGIRPESSHHEEGPSQNEIDFRYSEPLSAADNSLTFLSVVRSVAAANGLCADFSPKPLPEHPGSGLHINLSVRGGAEGAEPLNYVIAGILEHIGALTLFLNPCEDSYLRLGGRKAPRYISWSSENRSQLIRIPAAQGEFRRAELRSADPTANPYLAFALLIRAGLDGIERRLTLPEPADFNLYTAPPEVLSRYKRLPASLAEAAAAAQASPEVARWLPEPVLRACLGR